MTPYSDFRDSQTIYEIIRADMYRLVTSFAVHPRLSPAYEFLERFRGRELLLLASSRTAADELIRTYCRRHGAAFGIHRFTPTALAVEISSGQLAHTGTSILSGIAVDALAARTAHNCRARGELPWFDPVAETTGFSRCLGSTIHELRMNGIGPEMLRSGDLAALLSEYERGLVEAQVTDLAGILRITAANEASRYHGLPLLLLDVSPNTRMEWRFVEGLVRRAAAVLATAHVRNDRAIAELETILNIRAEQIAGKSETALDRLRTHVFSPSRPPAGGIDASIDFRSASDESREAIEVARSISIQAGEGARFDRMAILLRSPDTYQPLVEDALGRAGIPAYFTLGVRKPNPSGRAFLALLACAGEGLSASRFSEYLSIGQVPNPDANGAPPQVPAQWMPIQGELFPQPPSEPEAVAEIASVTAVRAPYRWERLLVDAAVIGGRTRWTQRLDGLEREFEKQIAEAGVDDEPLRLRIERQRAQLKDLRCFALPLIDALGRLPSAAAWREWLDTLERLAAMSLRDPDAVLSVLAELRPMAEVGPVHLDEVREVLTHRLTFLRMESNERRYGKVFVGAITEAAGMSFDTVFVPGLGEGIFPQRSFEDPLLLDGDRAAIDASLTVQDTRVEQERLLFHIAAATSERRLFISYPRMTLAQERTRGPSFYALEVFRAIHGRVPDLQELQRTAAEASQLQAGWPAPRDPENAIDDAEYDLAIIHRLMRAGPAERRGGARYLLSANPNLARSLYWRSRRWRSKWTESDGLADADHSILAVLDEHRLAARPYSATALQQFAACPYRFFLYAILRLEPRAEAIAIERMDPLTRGSLFHSIQFRLLTDLRSSGLLPVYAENRARVLQIADAVVDRTASEYRELLSPAIARVWNDEVEDVLWDIRGWLRELELAEAGDGWQPRWFELGFGIRTGDETDPQSSTSEIVLANGTRLRGSIDLVEEKDGAIRVTDHKTGKAPLSPPGSTGHGEVLQPLLYAQAAEILLHKRTEASRLSYCTDRGGYKIFDVPVHAESLRESANVLSVVDRSIAEGFLPAAPRKDACGFCDYRIVCGPYEEIRLQRKNSDPLAALEQLRRVP